MISVEFIKRSRFAAATGPCGSSTPWRQDAASSAAHTKSLHGEPWRRGAGRAFAAAEIERRRLLPEEVSGRFMCGRPQLAGPAG
jgi:hypothetical protein